VRHFYCAGLQDFKFEEKYDCIWIQWVLSHLSDKDAVDFFKRAKSHLNEGGLIVVKENHSKVGFLVDKEDYSVTRSTDLYKKLFVEAGLKILHE
jgi:protein N-terminal methyltransferase